MARLLRNRGLLTVPEPVIHVKAIYHRNNPIFTGSVPAVPPHTFTFFLAWRIRWLSGGVWKNSGFPESRVFGRTTLAAAGCST